MAPPRTCECMKSSCKTCYTREWARKRYREKAYGTWSPFADIDKVCEHLAALRAAGVGINAISDASNVGRATVSRIANGHQRKVTHAVAERLLAVTAEAQQKVSPVGTMRRLQGLAVLGWSLEELAPRVGTSPEYVGELQRGERRYILARTRDAVAAVFDELCMTEGPSDLVRVRAQRKRYVPPLAWDDIDNDPTPTGVREVSVPAPRRARASDSRSRAAASR